ncbi:hypothetical protein GSI_14042 [Ganoderma sinense ZZ0214-1]|uniref:Uncharacterized protein n=1 Tax=Ganoderma sinense ZZ0214-1 TaxID=1077348 RepID=A0A2G8RS01_9APHY|nr:hypothetical protein GSI_14042 [Ganoderma sinense ZZ0214-1]
MAPSVLARSLPTASRALLRAPRATRPVTVFARFNSDDAAARLNSIAAKARVVKTLPDFSMSNKVAVVTGAARGLGNEFCRAFIESGCTSLAIVDLKEDEAEHAAEELVKAACGQYRTPHPSPRAITPCPTPFSYHLCATRY